MSSSLSVSRGSIDLESSGTTDNDVKIDDEVECSKDKDTTLTSSKTSNILHAQNFEPSTGNDNAMLGMTENAMAAESNSGCSCSIYQLYCGVRDLYNDITKSITYMLISAVYAYFTAYLSSSIYASNKYLSIIMTLFLSCTASFKLGFVTFSLFFKLYNATKSQNMVHRLTPLRRHRRTSHIFTGTDGNVEVKVYIASIGFFLELMELITVAGIVLSVLQHDIYHTVIFSLSFTFNLISLLSSIWSMRKGNRVPSAGCYYVLMMIVGFLSAPFILVVQFLTMFLVMFKGPRAPEIKSMFEFISSPYMFAHNKFEGFIRASVPYFKSRGKRSHDSLYWY